MKPERFGWLLPFLLLSSCSLLEDTGLSVYEDEYAAEQTAASASMDEGGFFYMAEIAVDPSLYENWESEGQAVYDQDTGRFSLILTVDFPDAEAAVQLEIAYRLFDSQGVPQSSFDPAATASAELEMTMSHSLETSRFSGYTDKTGRLTITGLNTGTVSVTGQWEAQRTTTSGTAIALETSFDHSLDLTEMVYLRNEDTGDLTLTGGTARSRISGRVNSRSFSRSVDWIFGESYEAEMIWQGEVLTVNIQTGVIL